ncbi:DUF1054 family protein [Loigolactobacillus rennini]|uniref:Uncharacterized protein n=1 Tax=Loigolactobacillus rennini DSM 20253 TaxID=1423796 RepID=A0A0R2DFN3_9LACO|nr:DUF1054 family protein [Loigolactobacillus rennini]KRM99243.1 hypothetical protein FC24_GL000512 [Loigolactobacillus rennini DSM 20253]
MAFTQQDFAVFNDQTVAGRMALIREQLDPKFEALGAQLVSQLAKAQLPTYVNVAKHLRRHTNPAPNTWFAVGPYKRGYKMVPHFEVGLWADRLFVWLCLLENIQQPAPYAAILDQKRDLITNLPSSNWQLSGNHMAKASQPFTLKQLEAQTKRFKTVKRGEWLLGKFWQSNDQVFQTPGAVEEEIKQSVKQLTPLYRNLLSGIPTD